MYYKKQSVQTQKIGKKNSQDIGEKGTQVEDNKPELQSFKHLWPRAV